VDNEKAIKLGDAAMSRDPRLANYGLFSGGSFVLDSERVFMWFETIQDLVFFIKKAEPQIFELDAADIENYESQITPVLDNVQRDGLTDQLKNKINDISKDFMIIEWWGNFSELVANKSEFSKNLIEDFFEQFEEEPKSLSEEHMDSFVEFIQSYGY
jgi:hypothetical protein